MRYVQRRLSVGKKIPSSEGWFIQSWRSPKAVAIGCTRLTSSGALEGCQLLPQGRIPGKRCLGGETFISQRYCDPFSFMTPRAPRLIPIPHPTPPFPPPSLTFLYFWGVRPVRSLTYIPTPARRRHITRNSHIMYTGRGSSKDVPITLLRTATL